MVSDKTERLSADLGVLAAFDLIILMKVAANFGQSSETHRIAAPTSLYLALLELADKPSL